MTLEILSLFWLKPLTAGLDLAPHDGATRLREKHMPDFSAISSLLGAVKNVLEGIVGVAGSLAGDNVETVMGSLGTPEA